MDNDNAAICYKIQNVRWLQDDWGDYWIGELFCDARRVGLTGSYYSLDESGTRRYPRDVQERDLAIQLNQTWIPTADAVVQEPVETLCPN